MKKVLFAALLTFCVGVAMAKGKPNKEPDEPIYCVRVLHEVVCLWHR